MGYGMIKKLIIKNYRSIENLEVELTGLNALIGPNSSGKTNILKALDLIIGATYPTVRSFDESDFYKHERNRKIRIEVKFEKPVSWKSNYVWGFRLEFNGSECDYFALGEDGSTLHYDKEGREIKVTNEMREKVSMMYLSLDRQAHQQISPSQWKIYGKLLKHIADKIPDDSKRRFKDEVEKSFRENISDAVSKAEKLLKEYVKEQTGLELSLKLSCIDPTSVLRDLRPRIISSTGFDTDVENEGAGVQSAVVVAIARTYAEVVQQPLILAIEEPELYLHPHGCRHFYRILKELSQKGVQVIYTTHERSFVNIADLHAILLVKMENGGTKVYTYKRTVNDINTLGIASKFDEEMNEVFFANKVILVEGPADRIACKFALEKLGIELDKLNISIIECNSNTGIRPMAEVLQSFNIETYALIDEDPGNPETQKHIHAVKGLIGDARVLLQEPNLEGIFGLDKKPNKREALEFFPNYFKHNDPPQIYIELKNKMNLCEHRNHR